MIMNICQSKREIHFFLQEHALSGYQKALNTMRFDSTLRLLSKSSMFIGNAMAIFLR